MSRKLEVSLEMSQLIDFSLFSSNICELSKSTEIYKVSPRSGLGVCLIII